MIWTLPEVPTGADAVGEVRAALLVGALFLGLLGVAEAWRRIASPKPEWTRKFVHLSSGVVAAFFPWLFRTHWTLLILGTLMVGLFTLGRSRGWFASVTGVERASAGERWFPVGVYVLYVIARHQPLFYLIALTALVVSDTVAALLGTRYGLHTFPVAGGRKSIEGSAAFFVATFLGVLLPLLLFTATGRTECIVIALQLSLLATSVEAIGQHGNDNLIVPLATYYLLVKMTPYPWHAIGMQLAVQLGLLVACLLLARVTSFLSFAGALAAHLVLYGAFSLGGPGWTVAPALALAGYLLVNAFRERGTQRPPGGHQVQGVFYVSVVAVALLFGDNTVAMLPRGYGLDRPDHPFLALFAGALAAPLAITFGIEARLRRIAGAAWAAHWFVGACAGILVVGPLGLWAAGSRDLARDMASVALLVAVSIACYAWLRTLWPQHQEVPRDLRLRAASVAGAALIVTPLHLLWVRLG